MDNKYKNIYCLICIPEENLHKYSKTDLIKDNLIIHFINIHASLLPRWRGAAPIQRSLMNSDKETGISIMRIAEKLDTGPVCNNYKIQLDENNSEEGMVLV